MLLKFVRAFIPGLDDYSDDELLDILSDAKVLNNEIYDGYKNYMTDVVLLVETQNPFILHYEIHINANIFLYRNDHIKLYTR